MRNVRLPPSCHEIDISSMTRMLLLLLLVALPYVGYCQQIYDRSGSLMGRYEKGRLYNRSGSYEGKIESSRFYDRSGSYMGCMRNGSFYDRSGSFIGRIDGGVVYDRAGSKIGQERSVPDDVAALIYFYHLYNM